MLRSLLPSEFLAIDKEAFGAKFHTRMISPKQEHGLSADPGRSGRRVHLVENHMGGRIHSEIMDTGGRTN